MVSKAQEWEKMNEEQAEIRAIGVLSWIVNNEELLPVFLGASGAGESDLRQRIKDVEFLASVLDFLMMDDAWVVQYCDSENLPYDSPMHARQALPGGTDVAWT